MIFFPKLSQQKIEFFVDIWHEIQKSMAIWVKEINLLINDLISFTIMTTDFEFCAKYQQKN